jgi:hypothetical protein
MPKSKIIRVKIGTRAKVIAELKRIANSSNGILLPEEVVDAARSPSSILHKSFTWEDTEAAHQYRLWQARTLIRTTIRYVQINRDTRPARVFVSLTPDREDEGGGYREVIAVLSDKDMRKQLLQDALDELRTFEVKYAHLKELSGVFVASRKARNSLVSAWAA